jgi:phosphocarrier protein
VRQRTLRIPNRLGLHARAAARFVHTASRFDSRIRVSREGRTTDGKSILGILLLAAARGMSLRIVAQGRDEEEAVTTLAALVESGFGEGT